LWDESKKDLYLIRDRFGEKPLYYGWIEGEESSVFGFASELKALRKFPNFSNKVSKEALIQYDSTTKNPFVEVEVGDQKFERKDIELGISDGINVEVITGISEGDKIKVWNQLKPAANYGRG
jgi:asparagine synthetase B (glutamine-hydrolysing)